MKTIDYYNQKADEFVALTFHIAMGELYKPFIKHLPDCACILDLGCGSGLCFWEQSENWSCDGNSPTFVKLKNLNVGQIRQLNAIGTSPKNYFKNAMIFIITYL